MKKTTSGFTLIELLVVIAIIGILSSIVIASLNSARTKGAVSAAKGGAAQVRTQAEVYYDTATTGGNSVGYATSTACAVTVTTAGAVTVLPAGIASSGCIFADATIQNQLKQIATNANASVIGNVSTDFQKWGVSTTLKNNNQFCIDNSGNTKEQTTTATAAGVCS